MFFVTYLRRELRRRMRQSIFVALGLALGIGLVVTVSAASAGVKTAEGKVLGALYGVGTDVTVTGVQPGLSTLGRGSHETQNLGSGAHGPVLCTNGNCVSVNGKTVSFVNTPYTPIADTKVAEVASLHDVARAVGGLALVDQTATFPKVPTATFTALNNVYLEGVDTAHTSIGPLSAATLTSGHEFSAADADAAVAVVDSGYATSHRLAVGSTVTIDQANYTVIGIVDQPQGSNLTDVYLPLARAQAITTQIEGSVNDKVNTIYVTAASAADIPAVQREIATLLPDTTIDTASSLAGEVTGSVTSAAKLANDLGTWLSVLALIAAFAMASLLTMAAVGRRSGEFGTLKAIGWRSRRIIAQVLGESIAVGIAGAAAGVGVGFAGAWVIELVAPKLLADVSGNVHPLLAPAGAKELGPDFNHMVPVLLHPSVSATSIGLAVILALLGGLLAGMFASWRIARLRPAAALARVA